MSNTPGALIAMSGGVDSTVAAYLMKQAGCRCMGATMRLYQNEDLGQSGFHTCCSAKDVEDAAEVAFQLDIPFEVVNYTEEFREKVIAKFIETYETGGTPNPCIDCNRTMKFDKMLDFAREHGLDYVVTGHYARIEQDPATGRWLLKKALYADKDQSYVLYVLTQDQLRGSYYIWVPGKMQVGGRVAGGGVPDAPPRPSAAAHGWGSHADSGGMRAYRPTCSYPSSCSL